MRLLVWSIIGVLSITQSSAEIIVKKFQIAENQSINILQDSIVSTSHDSISNYHCTTNRPFKTDLSYSDLGVWDSFGECTGGGTIFGFFSNRTIYRVKDTSLSLFKTALDTTDTAAFSLSKDSFRHRDCITSIAESPQFTYPFDGGPGCPSSWNPVRYWFLSSTHEGKFLIFRFDTTCYSQENSQSRRIANSKITCIVQTDGTLDFSKAFESNTIRKGQFSTRFAKIVPHTTAMKSLSSGVARQHNCIYTIQGKRINNYNMNRQSRNSINLYIISGQYY